MTDAKSIPVEQKIYTEAWNFFKKHHVPKTEQEWDACISDLDSLRTLAQNDAQDILARSFANGIIEYYMALSKNER